MRFRKSEVIIISIITASWWAMSRRWGENIYILTNTEMGLEGLSDLSKMLGLIVGKIRHGKEPSWLPVQLSFLQTTICLHFGNECISDNTLHSLQCYWYHTILRSMTLLPVFKAPNDGQMSEWTVTNGRRRMRRGPTSPRLFPQRRAGERHHQFPRRTN